MKEASAEELKTTALQVRELCRAHSATFIIDDHVELTKEVGADGVHLGKQDMPLRQAREFLGKDFIIGGTANSIDDIRRHAVNGADYIGCGPFRFTSTKRNLAPILGEEGYRRLLHTMEEEGISLPLIAIGGITRADIPMLKALGVQGIALSGGILQSDNPVEEMKRVMLLADGA